MRAVPSAVAEAFVLVPDALSLFLPMPASADTVLFTASTDNTGGAFPVSVPGTNNPNIPTIDPGVTLNPNPALLDGFQTGPLGGVTYGPFGFGGNGGGNTGWVSVSDTVSVSGLYRLIWEVAGADPKIGSALAFDNVRMNGSLLFGFEGGIPGGFNPLGTVGTSGSVPVSDPVGGTSPPPSARPRGACSPIWTSRAGSRRSTTPSTVTSGRGSTRRCSTSTRVTR